MPARKSILKRYEVETAKRERHCDFSRRAIAKGEQCLVVWDGYRERYNYSREVAEKMLKKAIEDLRQLQEQFASNERA